jgi:hypothetical protein
LLFLGLAMVVGGMEVSDVLVAGARVVDESLVGMRVVGVWDGTCMVVWYSLIPQSASKNMVELEVYAY